MHTYLKRTSFVLALLMAMLFIQSCRSSQQAIIPASPVSLPPPVSTPPPVVDLHEITVFYDSDPPGAVLYEMGKNVKSGETPFWVTYRLSDAELQAGRAFIEPLRLLWPSGAATSNHPGFVFRLDKGRQQTFMFIRPDLPGREADYDAGLKGMMQRFEKGEGD